MELRAFLIALMVLLAAGSARADGDEELAKRRFATGELLFARSDYRGALVEFEAAQRVLHRAEFDYNIALCLAEIGRGRDAAAAFERYASARPGTPQAAAAWQRAAELLQREVERPPDAPRSTLALREPRFTQLAIGRAAIATSFFATGLLVAGAVTGGLTLSERQVYDRSCDLGHCDQPLYDHGRSLGIATNVLLGVGAAVGIAAIALSAMMPRALRRARQLRAVSSVPLTVTF